MWSVKIFYKDNTETAEMPCTLAEWEDGVLSLAFGDKSTPWKKAIHVPMDGIKYFTMAEREKEKS